MALVIRHWTCYVYGHGPVPDSVYLPFSLGYNAHDDRMDNVIELSKLSAGSKWFIRINFDQVDVKSPDCPYSAVVHVKDAFNVIEFKVPETGRCDQVVNQVGVGPIPVVADKYHVQIVIRNKAGIELAAQSGDIVVKPG